MTRFFIKDKNVYKRLLQLLIMLVLYAMATIAGN